MAKIYDVVAIVGEKQDGKPRYQNCGFVFEKEDGKKSLKLNSIPVFKDWDGWFLLFDAEPKEAPPAKQPEDTEIPF